VKTHKFAIVFQAETSLVVSGNVVPLIIFIGIATGIWWPIIKAIIESPMHALWLIPVGFIFSEFAFWIQSVIYSILVWPLVALSGWLLHDE
jgi:hypothetical protein